MDGPGSVADFSMARRAAQVGVTGEKICVGMDFAENSCYD